MSYIDKIAKLLEWFKLVSLIVMIFFPLGMI